jgi:hypothetical protein
MENNSGDQKVIDLLSKLKNNQNAYPSDRLRLRRQKFLQQAAQAGLAMGAAAGLRNTLKAKGTRLAPTAGKWLEVALVVAIVAEVSMAAYFYRHKLVDFLETFVTTPVVQKAISVPGVTSPFPATEMSVVPTATPTGTPTATPAPGVIGDVITNNNSNDNTDNNNDASGGNNPSASTPVPNENNGNNGNHFGQTKQPPKATKEPKDTKVPKNK